MGKESSLIDATKRTGLWDPYVRWWVFFSFMTSSLFTILLAGMAGFITASDRTGISWLTLVVFWAASIHFGTRVRREGSGVDTALTKYATEQCTSLGFLGTIVGLVLMVVGAFGGLDIKNPESIQAAVVSMARGVGTALVTTLVGLVCALLLEFQMALVTLRWGRK